MKRLRVRAGMWSYFKQTSRKKWWCSEMRNVNEWSETFFFMCFLGITFSAYTTLPPSVAMSRRARVLARSVYPLVT